MSMSEREYGIDLVPLAHASRSLDISKEETKRQEHPVSSGLEKPSPIYCSWFVLGCCSVCLFLEYYEAVALFNALSRIDNAVV